ncbi:hypothetical protein BV898_09076 [Hypsibius exemplaris]|uniref:Nucleotide exchange factor Fes1 domain-containing protein n=1 Tax=Hypsibius exemplaris TaxID=2072580 RepID=A0A1W0WNV1_HYPEX|nr:hypothetical protein BV898_09076 [Hypsibius exemplaris]
MERNSNPQPKDLLNMAIQASVEVGKAEDTAGMNGLMDPERRKWLESVMASVFGQNIDPVKQMKSCLAVLESLEADETQKSHSLDVLLSLTESIDVANDLFKIGGFPVLQACLTGSESGGEFRQKAAEIFSQLMQNNPFCQAKAVEGGYLPLWLDQMEKETQPQTRIKLLSALSSLLRSSPEAQRAFEQLDGLSALLRCMISSKDGKFQTSAAFMLSRVCSENAAFIDHLAKMGFVHHFVALLQQKETASSQLREHLTEVLSIVLRHSALARQDAAERQLNLPAFLQQRQKEIAGQEEFQEESEYIEEILKVLP